MKYFGTRKMLLWHLRKLFISENQTAEFAADSVDDDPANLDGRDTIHIMDIVVALSTAESSDKSPIPQNIVSNAQLSKLSSNLTFDFNSEGVKQLAGLEYKSYMIPAV